MRNFSASLDYKAHSSEEAHSSKMEDSLQQM